MIRLFILFVVLSSSLHAAPELRSSDAVSTTGSFRLSWGSAIALLSTQHSDYLLEECSADGCRPVYNGHDRSTVISGRPDGIYRFRISEVGSPGSYGETSVEVRHHDLSRSVIVLSGGFVLFMLCAAALLFGEIRLRSPRGGEA